MGEQEALGKGSTDGALVPKEASAQPPHQARHRTPIVGVAWSQTDGKSIATGVDDQMEFEAREPSHRRLASSRVNPKHPMLPDARRMADAERGGVDEAAP